nr:MAG TPA: Chromosome region maintenance protein [Caudoviricetes sp.]
MQSIYRYSFIHPFFLSVYPCIFKICKTWWQNARK